MHMMKILIVKFKLPFCHSTKHGKIDYLYYLMSMLHLQHL